MNVSQHIKSFILQKDHPCLMAQTVMKSNHVIIKEYLHPIGDIDNLKALKRDILSYLKQYDFSSPEPFSFVATFGNSEIFSEKEFETRFWTVLNQLHKSDEYDWDPTVSDDPDNPEFSFSFGGHAFYVIGLHPNSSRLARQAPYNTMVFNLHHQFELLRELNTYDRVKEIIRERDKNLQGSINPMLEDFGSGSEARQYSGRAVDSKWECPFHKNK